jgi:hypothetical protein
MQTALNRAIQHRRAADAGIYFLDDGSDGAVEQRGLEDARVSLDRARGDLAAAERDVESAQHVVGRRQRLFDRSRSADVTAPPGAIIWIDSPAAGRRGSCWAARCRLDSTAAPCWSTRRSPTWESRSSTPARTAASCSKANGGRAPAR